MGAMTAARQNFDAAIDAYSKRVDVQPNDADAHQDLGDTYARLGRQDEALAEFAMALTIDRHRRADAYASLAQIYLQRGPVRRGGERREPRARPGSLATGRPATRWARP